MAEEAEHHELVERWIEALRSGDYLQAIRFNEAKLRSMESDYKLRYNVFGVFCDLYDPSGWEIDEDHQHYYKSNLPYRNKRAKPNWYGYIPVQITSHLGMMDSTSIRQHISMKTSRVFYSLTFTEIATELEELLL